MYDPTCFFFTVAVVAFIAASMNTTMVVQSPVNLL
jgi:hypothetical protein